jgi:hypothetical protein
MAGARRSGTTARVPRDHPRTRMPACTLRSRPEVVLVRPRLLPRPGRGAEGSQRPAPELVQADCRHPPADRREARRAPGAARRLPAGRLPTRTATRPSTRAPSSCSPRSSRSGSRSCARGEVGEPRTSLQERRRVDPDGVDQRRAPAGSATKDGEGANNLASDAPASGAAGSSS